MGKVIISILLLCIALCSYGQTEQQEINSIKADTIYLYATGTSISSVDEASANAKDLLALEIEQWLKENKIDDIAGYIAKSRESLSQIKTKRGNLSRVFVYVKKTDILPYYKGDDVMMVGVEPKLENSENAKYEAVTKEIEISKPSHTTSIEIPQADTIVLEKKVEEITYQLSNKEREMLNIKTFLALNDYINRGRESQDIVDVGKYSNLPQTGMVYVFIHNRQGEIPACIKVTDGKTLNLATNSQDSISNYKGCGAIWIKFR